ncbi:L-amino acid N-acyltransferase YncA [Kitasatospora atroaurantiaca]|uniref:L-amino acid N-acyltransferase YncA n=2 Tax=Kitasatospora atroaurantiaca TaxID=285545 RepID=A0A561EM49_9ACTN|nr:GNAT family N-acetyltransferase [Kitasatospora atroaurantiaca]TWE16696.1 L-amino acid N-acyltransferase YncA [Kitasatospora atroaurantiaca]
MAAMRADGVTIRAARAKDERSLVALDRAAWSWLSDVIPQPAEDATIFDERCTPDQYLLAELDGRIVGYIRHVPPTPLPSNQHIRQIRGLAVSPAARGRGIGRALVEAACDAARAEGIRRMTLRVLAHNAPARRLYERCGFQVDGVSPEEFWIDGAYVDDIAMGRRLNG